MVEPKIDGVQVVSVENGRTTIISGQYKMIFIEDENGNAKIIGRIFLGKQILERDDNIPSRFFKPAIARANAILRDRRRRTQIKVKNRPLREANL